MIRDGHPMLWGHYSSAMVWWHYASMKCLIPFKNISVQVADNVHFHYDMTHSFLNLKTKHQQYYKYEKSLTEMFRKFLALGTTAASSMAIGHYSFPYSKTWLPVPPPKEYKINVTMSTIASISLCTSIGVLYWKGVGFADIAYATRRSVTTLTSALELAKKSILSRITGLERTFEARSNKIEDKIVNEARQIRQDIDALHSDQTSLGTVLRLDINNLHKDQKKLGSEVTEIHQKVTEMNQKVTNMEMLTMLSSRGVSLLCTTLDKSKYINSIF